MESIPIRRRANRDNYRELQSLDLAGRPTIALVAALCDELAPSSQRLERSNIVTRVTGIGRQRALLAIDNLVENQHIDHVIHLGAAGGLDPTLEAGTVIRVGRVIDEHGNAVDLESPDAPVLLTIDRLVDSVDAKRRLFDQFAAAAVDMETFHVARRLHNAGIPVTAMRAITDSADTALPPDATQWVTADGAADLWAAMRHLANHPWELACLWRLRRSMRVAMQNLAAEVVRVVAEIEGGGGGGASSE